mgnify:CR=1 FL=1
MDYSNLRRTVKQLLKDEWINQKKGLRELDLTHDEIRFFIRESREMILNFLDDFIKNKGFERTAPVIEKTLFSKNLKFLGRIDAMYRNKAPPLLVDFKTSKSKEILDDYKRQLGMYALLYRENFGTSCALAIHFLKFKDGFKRFTVSEKYIDKIKNLVNDIHEKTSSDNIEDYPCTCGWCDKNFELKARKKNGSDR